MPPIPALHKPRALCEPCGMDESEAEARAAARDVGVDLPAECVPGVIDNLALLASHAALLDRFLAEHPDP